MLPKGKGSQKQAKKMDSGGAITTEVVGKPVSILHSSKSMQKLSNKLTKRGECTKRDGNDHTQPVDLKVCPPSRIFPNGSGEQGQPEFRPTDLDLNLKDNKDDHVFNAKEDTDSISNMITSTRKELFKAGVEAAQGNQGGVKRKRLTCRGNKKHGSLSPNRQQSW
jgi:hypothetical protein